MKKLLLLSLFFASSSFGMDNEKKDELTNQDEKEEILDASIDPFQIKLLQELKTISSELKKMNEQKEKENLVNELHAASNAFSIASKYGNRNALNCISFRFIQLINLLYNKNNLDTNLFID